MRQLLALLRLLAGHGAPDLALVTLLGSGKGALDDAELSQLADAVADQGVESALRPLPTSGLLTPGKRGNAWVGCWPCGPIGRQPTAWPIR